MGNHNPEGNYIEEVLSIETSSLAPVVREVLLDDIVVVGIIDEVHSTELPQLRNIDHANVVAQEDLHSLIKLVTLPSSYLRRCP